MLGNRYLNLEGWTADRLTELRRVAATEAQLKASDKGRRPSWLQDMVAHVGRTLVSWGIWLEAQSHRPLGLEH